MVSAVFNPPRDQDLREQKLDCVEECFRRFSRGKHAHFRKSDSAPSQLPLHSC